MQRFNIADGHQSTCFFGDAHFSVPSASVATTGTPASMACTTTRGSPSRYEGCTSRSQDWINDGISEEGTIPVTTIRSAMPSFRAKAKRDSFLQPSPTQSNRRRSSCCIKGAIACKRSS